MATISITGYTDQVSVKPGETVDIKVSAENIDTAHIEIVRILHGDEHPDGPGFIEVAVPSDVQGDHPVRKQFVDTGNAVVVEDAAGRLALTDSVSIVAIVFPTTPLKIGRAHV